MKNNIYEQPEIEIELITLAVGDIITSSQLQDGNDWTEIKEGSTGFDEWGQ